MKKEKEKSIYRTIYITTKLIKNNNLHLVVFAFFFHVFGLYHVF